METIPFEEKIKTIKFENNDQQDRYKSFVTKKDKNERARGFTKVRDLLIGF